MVSPSEGWELRGATASVMAGRLLHLELRLAGPAMGAGDNALVCSLAPALRPSRIAPMGCANLLGEAGSGGNVWVRTPVARAAGFEFVAGGVWPLARGWEGA